MDWINVNTINPRFALNVLVNVHVTLESGSTGDYVTLGRKSGNEWTVLHDTEFVPLDANKSVTHWMPLPPTAERADGREARRKTMDYFSSKDYAERLINGREPCIIITTNGYQVHNAVILAESEEEDAFLVQKQNGREQMMYKHSISTIRPALPMFSASAEVREEKNETEE